MPTPDGLPSCTMCPDFLSTKIPCAHIAAVCVQLCTDPYSVWTNIIRNLHIHCTNIQLGVASSRSMAHKTTPLVRNGSASDFRYRVASRRKSAGICTYIHLESSVGV